MGMMRVRTNVRGGRRDGAVLIVTIWVVLTLAGLVLVSAGAAKSFTATSRNHAMDVRADVAAEGGIALAKAIVDGAVDDTGLYEAVEIADSYCWFIKMDMESEGGIAYGLEDLGGRVNLNTATREMLLALPEMTEAIADAIIDWRDTDDELSPMGAENEYYMQLDEPYQCKNDRFESVEELLLVKGVTRELLFGEDYNQNGLLDLNEDDGDGMLPRDDKDGVLDYGWAVYLTVDSQHPNVSANGEERVNVNERQNRRLEQLLLNKLESSSRAQLVYNLARTRRPFSNIFDFYQKTTLTREEFALIADLITTSDEGMLLGRININTAPYHVLMTLPGFESSDAYSVIFTRNNARESTGAGEGDTDITWLLDAVTTEKAVNIGGLVTGVSMQYQADLVVLNRSGYGYTRRLVVLDRSDGVTRVLRHQNMSHLGWPLDPVYLSGLRASQSMIDLHDEVKYK